MNKEQLIALINESDLDQIRCLLCEIMGDGSYMTDEWDSEVFKYDDCDYQVNKLTELMGELSTAELYKLRAKVKRDNIDMLVS